MGSTSQKEGCHKANILAGSSISGSVLCQAGHSRRGLGAIVEMCHDNPVSKMVP